MKLLKHTLKTKVINLENKIPDATTLIDINQYNTYKQKEKIENADKDKYKYQIRVV